MTDSNTNRQCRTDDRAVSEILGAIMVFGILLALLFLIQMTAVPTWNQQVEYDHDQRVQGDVGEIGNAIERVQASGTAESVGVELGLRYPYRPLLYNPPAVSGELQTVPNGDIVVEGANASDEVGDFWDGSELSYPTRSITYSADYNEYNDAPVRTVYEHGTVANRFDGEVTIVRQPRQVVRDNAINLVALTGEVDRDSVEPTTVQVTPVTRSARTISVTGANGDDITISLRTTLPEATWNELLADELDNGHVLSVDYTAATSPATVTITLDGAETYTLRTALVGVGTNLDETQPAYLERIAGGGEFVPVGASDRLTVEVRDQFNAPVTGVDVTYDVVEGSGEFVGDSTPGDNSHTRQSDSNGQTSVVFEPGTTGTVTVEATANLNGVAGTQEEEVVRFEMSTTADGDGEGGDGGVINPSDPLSIRLDDVSRQGPPDATLTFENLDEVSEWTYIRAAFILKQAGGPSPAGIEITPEGKNTISMGFGDDFEEITPTPLSFGPAGSSTDERTVTLNLVGSGGGFNNGDLLVINTLNQDGRLATYFVTFS